MQIQILSDLHLEIERPNSEPGREFYHYDIPVRAETLALLGDIGWTVEDRLFEWLRDQLRLFKTIFFVSGNHGTCATRLTPSMGAHKSLLVYHRRALPNDDSESAL